MFASPQLNLESPTYPVSSLWAFVSFFFQDTGFNNKQHNDRIQNCFVPFLRFLFVLFHVHMQCLLHVWKLIMKVALRQSYKLRDAGTEFKLILLLNTTWTFSLPQIKGEGGNKRIGFHAISIRRYQLKAISILFVSV